MLDQSLNIGLILQANSRLVSIQRVGLWASDEVQVVLVYGVRYFVMSEHEERYGNDSFHSVKLNKLLTNSIHPS